MDLINVAPQISLVEEHLVAVVAAEATNPAVDGHHVTTQVTHDQIRPGTFLKRKQQR